MELDNSQKIDVVMFNMSAYSEWQAGFVNRNSHVLHELLASDKVRKIVAIDYLPLTFKKALKIWLQGVLHFKAGKKMSGGFFSRLTALSNSEINKTVYKVSNNDDVEYRLFNYSTVLSYFSEDKMLDDLNSSLAKLNLKNVVVWSYLPTFVGCFDKIQCRLKVFDAVDNWLEHSAYKSITDRLKLNYEIIKNKSDLIFTTSKEMVRYFDKRDGVFYIPNGVRWQMYKEPPKIVSRDIASLPRPIIGYVGILQQDRIDLDLIRYLAENNPKKTFAFVGPVWPNFRKKLDSKLGDLKNVHFLGRKQYGEVPSYVSQFDVAIVPHLLNEFGKHTSLLKMMEYLAAGKPVVSTPTSGTDAFKKVVKLADTPEKFNKAIINSLTRDSMQSVKHRQETAWQYSWTEQVNIMLDKVIASINYE